MNIKSLILSATRANHDTITLTPCGDGTLIKSYSSRELGDVIGGGNILSAGGSSSAQMRPESLMDLLDSLGDDDVRGLKAVGWLFDVSHDKLTLFANPAAGGRRHSYHERVATYRQNLRRVA